MPVVTNLLLPDSAFATAVRFRPYINTQSPDGWPWLYCHLFQWSLAVKPSNGHVRRSIPRIGIRGCLYVFVYSKYINYIGCWMCPVLPNQLRQCTFKPYGSALLLNDSRLQHLAARFHMVGEAGVEPASHVHKWRYLRGIVDIRVSSLVLAGSRPTSIPRLLLIFNIITL